jgi:protein-tyrosine sulfotransferase
MMKVRSYDNLHYLLLSKKLKYIFMVRDGRATVNSIISRKVTVTGFDLNDYRASMQKWNNMIKTMFVQCELLGRDKCLMVYYEKLVLEPKESMKKILEFLNLPWNENVLHHEDFINKTHGIALSKYVHNVARTHLPSAY